MPRLCLLLEAPYLRRSHREKGSSGLEQKYRKTPANRAPGKRELLPGVAGRILHETLLAALGDCVVCHSDIRAKPLDVSMRPPLPARARFYMYTITDPPGGRSLGEHKIQLIAPGQRRGDLGVLDFSGGSMVYLAGYHPQTNVFVLWDAAFYRSFAHSRNVQVDGGTLYAALALGTSSQQRQLRDGTETVLAARYSNLAAALERRFVETIAALIPSEVD